MSRLFWHFLRNALFLISPSFLFPLFASAADASFDQSLTLAGKRVVTINSVIRVNQIEVTRDRNVGSDEGNVHNPETAVKFRKAVFDAIPEAKVTWAFSWLALHDQRPNYEALRKKIVEFHHLYGDEITFIPGAYFAPIYNSREQVNQDIHDGLALVSEMVGDGYRPHALVAGYLAAENLRYLAETERIHVAQGTIWSQYGIDNGDGDGSICYPYYPSREHGCKPAQSSRTSAENGAPGGKSDFIDCVNLDGWTCDFLCARRFGFEGGANSRLGVGPIEAYGNLGKERGMEEAMAVTANHFETNFKENGFGWVTVCWELSLVNTMPNDVTDCLTLWLQNIRKRWPDAIVPTLGEFGEAWRRANPDNSNLRYHFVQRGTGVEGAHSEPNLEMEWYMNQHFRLALLRDWQKGEPAEVIDLTRYDLPAKEPADPAPGEAVRNWSLINRINQKQRRPEDSPIPLTELADDDKKLIRSVLPNLFSEKEASK